jgi:hypothetical protein
MATATSYQFSYREIAEMLVRKVGVTEGIWGLEVRFGFQVTNIGPSDENLLPAVIVPVVEIGLQKFDRLTNLSVDAAELAKADQKLKNR